MAAQPSETIDTSNYVYLCMTAHFWGKGKSPELALRYCREAGGGEMIKRHGYRTYHVHPEFEINCVNGQVATPLGHPAILVVDKKKT